MSRIIALIALTALSFLAQQAPGRAGQPNGDVRELVDAVLPSVVSIYMRGVLPPDSSGDGRSAAGPPRIFEEVGSGFIVDPNGLIVTNRHVIKGAYEVYVTLHGGTRVPARIVGEGTTFDLAVIKIESDKPLPAVKIGDSDQIARGDRVVAIGNPLGFKESVTAGIVSALNRDIGLSAYDDLIQTDAVINQGNSGGPMFNMQGEVVGINQAIYTTSKGAGSIGLGFAIPVNEAKFMLEQIRKFGKPRIGWLGADFQSLTPEMADAFGLGFGSGNGVVLTSVDPNGPAAQAGLRQGDAITRFGDRDIRDSSELNRAIAISLDKTVPLQIMREGKSSPIGVKIAEWPDQLWATSSAKAPALNTTRDFGLAFTETPSPDGLKIDSVVDKSTAAVAGMRPGDVVQQVQFIPMRSADDFQKVLTDMHGKGQRNVAVLLTGQSSPRWVSLPLR